MKFKCIIEAHRQNDCWELQKAPGPTPERLPRFYNQQMRRVFQVGKPKNKNQEQ